MRWLRRPIHLTNNINPNIYRFLRQRGVLTTIIISYEIRTICFERVSVANWNHSKDATVRSVTSERERNLTKHASTERQRSFVLGRSTTFTNAIPSVFYAPIPWQHYMAIYFWRLRLTEMLSTNTQSQIIINIRWYMMSFLKINKIF